MRISRAAGIIGVVFCLLCLAAAPARAEITQKDFHLFLRESYGSIVGPVDGIDMEDVLYQAARAGKTPRGMVSAFGKALALTDSRAKRYAALIVASVKHRVNCGRAGSQDGCELLRNTALVDGIRTTGFKDTTGQLLLAVGKNVATRNGQEQHFISLVRTHPALKVISLGLYDYTSHFVYVLSLLSTRPLDVHSLLFVLTKDQFYNAEYDLAALDVARRRLDGPARLLMSRILIDQLIKKGLTREAVREYSRIRGSDRQGMWPESGKFDRVWVSEKLIRAYVALKGKSAAKADDGAKVTTRRVPGGTVKEQVQEANGDSIVSLAAVLHFEGRTREARRLLNHVASQHLRFSSLQRLHFLEEVLDPSLAGDDVYDVFLEGRDAEKKAKKKEMISIWSGSDGWLASLSGGAPVFQELGSRYLSTNGYPRMARYLLSLPILHNDESGKDVYASFAKEAGPIFDRRRAYYRKQIDIAKAARKAKSKAPRTDVTPTPIRITERPVVFEERPLPKGIKPFAPPASGTGKSGKKEESGPPRGLQLPVKPYQVVRLEKVGHEWMLIFLSEAVDPVAEIVGWGGYWITKSRARGHGWERPVYLGLQHFFPYVIVPRSNLPLMKDNVLQIEVQVRELVRELDSRPHTFPPFGLRLRRRQDGLYLRFDWDKLTRDRDSDGLTDIAEQRMGLDPDNPDTDDDGLNDGSDSLPLTPFRPRKPEENKLAIAILKQVLGYDRQAIIVGDVSPRTGTSPEHILKSALGPNPVIDSMHTTSIVSDPGIFTGIRLRTRLLVYGPDALERLEKQHGVFYPVRVQWVFSNKSGTKHHVIWSEIWQGGNFDVIKTRDGYKVMNARSWIT